MKKKTRNIDDYTLNEMFKFKENINGFYITMKWVKSEDYVNKVIIKGNGDEKGVYLAETKTFVEKILSGALVLVFLIIIGAMAGLIEGGVFNINNIVKQIIYRLK